MANFALINSETRIVENVFALDEGTSYHAPEGFEIKPLGKNVGIGWSHVDGEWVEPTEPDPEPAPEPETEAE